jgi:NDP-sugar pyrophosphorylase family protein
MQRDISAIILAAGESRRFWPLSAGRHKSLFGLNGMSIVQRTITSLEGIGVRDIVVVQSPRGVDATGRPGLLPSDLLDDRYTFVTQPEPLGQGDALLRCADHVGEEFLVVQPENINAGDVGLECLANLHDDSVAVVAGQERADFPLFAVMEHDDGVLRSIVEKPATASVPEPLCNMGLYLFRRPLLSVLAGTPAGPYQLIDCLGEAAQDKAVRVFASKNRFLPLKYPEHLWAYVDLIGDEFPGGRPRVLVEQPATVADASGLVDVIVGARSRVGSGVRVAPGDEPRTTVVGMDTVVEDDVTIAAGVRIGSGVTVRQGAVVEEDVPDGETV